MAKMKPDHVAFIREAGEITTLLERLHDLIEAFVAAPPDQEGAIRAEIDSVKERIKRFALRYQN